MGSASRPTEVESLPWSHAWRSAKGCRPLGDNPRCASVDNPVNCLLKLRSRFVFGKRATGTFSCACAHAAVPRRDGSLWVAVRRMPSSRSMVDTHGGKRSGDVAFPWCASAAARSDCKMCVGTYKSSFGRFVRTYNLALWGLLASFRVPAARGSACANR